MSLTEPYLLDLSFRGFIEGTTYISPSTRKPQCHYFGGIPYALPPVGSYRWRQARALPPCYRYGTRANPGRFTGGTAICPQPGLAKGNASFIDEDCLQCNVWVPVGERPTDEQFCSHYQTDGGFLQFGNANDYKFTSLLAQTDCQCIIVSPGYRLNLFGFLASRELGEEAKKYGEPLGNFGFWDQRLALEWTYKNISYFGGNAASITVGGISAGAYSTFHQLSHDIYLPPNRRIIRRALMMSNGAGMQPKPLTSAQSQFDSLLTTLSIPLSLSPAEKITHLRALPPKSLITASVKVPAHEFRPYTDGAFVRTSLFSDIQSGAYAAKLKEANVHLIIGEVPDEHFMYGDWRTPTTQSLNALRTRFCAEYPEPVVSALLDHVYCPNVTLPTTTWPECKEWTPDAFGRIYADLQVHALERGFVDCLVRGGAAELVHRYRIEFRAKCVDATVPPEWGVTHTTDMPLWFFGGGDTEALSEKEKRIARRFFEPAWGFFRGLEGWERGWGADAKRREVRLLGSDGSVAVWVDEDYERGLRVWDVVRAAQKGDGEGKAAKL